MILSFAEMLTYSTLRIECMTQDGMTRGTGTAFVFDISTTNQPIPIVITNKHVIENMYLFQMYMCTEDEFGMPIDQDYVHLSCTSYDNCWIPHPDENIDLCAVRLDALVNNSDLGGRKLFIPTLDLTYIPEQSDIDDLDAIEQVFVIGYPNGLWDELNNKPIVKSGITATHYKNNYDGSPEFLVDCAIVGGSSGSPVFIYNKGIYTSKNATYFKNRCLLLGIVYQGSLHRAEGIFKTHNFEKVQEHIVESYIPSNIGFVIKSEAIKAFIPFFND